MTASFNLTLDTRAPVVTWGPVHDAVAGETLRIEFLVDEPGLESASITLRDGRVLPMEETVAGELWVLLPEDAPDGQAVARATTRDEVWNERTFTLNVLVSGVPWEPPQPPVAPAGGMPQVAPRLITTPPSRCGARSRYTVTAVSTSRTRLRTRSRYSSPGFRQKVGIRRRLRLLTHDDELLVRVSTRSGGKLLSGGAATASSENTVRKRPEGPGAEDELILLDLL